MEDDAWLLWELGAIKRSEIVGMSTTYAAHEILIYTRQGLDYPIASLKFEYFPKGISYSEVMEWLTKKTDGNLDLADLSHIYGSSAEKGN